MSVVQPFVVVWYRNDLRSYDHPGLTQAQQTGLPVLALFIATPETWSTHDMAPMKQDLLRRRATALQQELAELQIPMLCVEASRYADTPDVLRELAQQGAVQVFAQREYELREQHRDACVSQMLAEFDAVLQLHDSQCVMLPGSILSKTGEHYKVFTPYKKTWLARLRTAGYAVEPKPLVQTQPLPPIHSRWPAMRQGDNSSIAYPVQEREVLERLREFCRERVAFYHTQRDFPALDGTSGLSAYLAIGVVSPKQCLARLQLEAGEQIWQDDSGAAIWLSELIWREFYKHLLLVYPQLIKHQPFQADTAALAWSDNQAWFEAWCEGRTGYPIVDAAMRQLNSTGWMHNRLRMIVASFLVKDLQIDWRWGERYFMQKLIDGDFAANNGGWQWAASTGTDAAPYFRIFNPVTQSEKFDPKGIFLRKYLPELEKLTGKALHWPHPLPMSVQYPKPIVDHAKARERTLAMFKAVRGAVDGNDT